MRDMYVVAAAAVVRYSLAGYIQSVHCSAVLQQEERSRRSQTASNEGPSIRVNNGVLNLGSRVLPRRVVSCKTFLRRLWTNLDETLMDF